MVGSAVLTTEMSRTTRIWAISATASTAQDRRSVVSGCSGETTAGGLLGADGDSRTLMAAPDG